MEFELDHLFVASAPGGPESALLRAAGFVAGPPHDHPGQGTASLSFHFENAYLELLWLTDGATAAAQPIRATGLHRRADPGSGASPFGFGLRHPREPVPPPPFEAWDYAPPYLPDGAAFKMAANAASLDEPLVFVLPWARTPSWEVPEHPAGARRVTRVAFTPRPPRPTRALADFLSLGLVKAEAGGGPLLAVELDEGAQRRVVDFRPGLPLVVRW